MEFAMQTGAKRPSPFNTIWIWRAHARPNHLLRDQKVGNLLRFGSHPVQILIARVCVYALGERGRLRVSKSLCFFFVRCCESRQSSLVIVSLTRQKYECIPVCGEEKPTSPERMYENQVNWRALVLFIHQNRSATSCMRNSLFCGETDYIFVLYSWITEIAGDVSLVDVWNLKSCTWIGVNKTGCRVDSISFILSNN